MWFWRRVIKGFFAPENEDNWNAAKPPWMATYESYPHTSYNKPKILDSRDGSRKQVTYR
jgi:hypothetical protein